MCQLKVYTKDSDELIMEDVVGINVDGDNVVLRGLFGDTKEIPGRISEVNISKQRAIVEAK